MEGKSQSQEQQKLWYSLEYTQEGKVQNLHKPPTPPQGMKDDI